MHSSSTLNGYRRHITRHSWSRLPILASDFGPLQSCCAWMHSFVASACPFPRLKMASHATVLAILALQKRNRRTGKQINETKTKVLLRFIHVTIELERGGGREEKVGLLCLQDKACMLQGQETRSPWAFGKVGLTECPRCCQESLYKASLNMTCPSCSQQNKIREASIIRHIIPI